MRPLSQPQADALELLGLDMFMSSFIWSSAPFYLLSTGETVPMCMNRPKLL